MPATKRSHDESAAHQRTKRQCRQGPSHSEVDVQTHHRYNLRKRHRQNETNDNPPTKKRSAQPVSRRRAARPLSPVSSSASSLIASASAPCTPPHVPLTPQPSPPLTASPKVQESYWFPPISALAEPQEFPDLAFFTSFRCTFLREINSSETASVLLVALPDGSQRILKLFFPQPEEEHDPGTNEYLAYCSLIAQGVCRPPSDSAAKRIVPYCYGVVVLNDLRVQMKRHTLWKGPAKKMLRKGSLCGLLIEFLPDCTTIMDDPSRLLSQPKLQDDIIAALRMIHGAGVLHEDPLPRNIMVDSEGGVWWVDFGSAETTSHSSIHPDHFACEVMRVELMLRDDVIPAAREGRTPECEF